MTPYNNFRSTKYLGSLDILRCFAIIGVIWQHSPAIPHNEMPFTNVGASGVALFFVISGFLITTLLLREESTTGTFCYRNFYIRRCLRIFPLYYSVLFLYLILVLLLEINNAAGKLFISNLPYYLTYTSNWFVDLIINDDGERRVIFIFAWSLATEEQFYIFWPTIMKFFSRRKAIIILIGVLLTDLLITFIFGKPKIPTTILERLLKIATSISSEICCGVLLALALHSKKYFSNIYRFLGQVWSAPFAALLTLSVLFAPGNASTGWYAIQSIAFCFLLGTVVVREDHGLSWILKFPLLKRIGIVSYGMYMLHMLTINVIRKVMSQFNFDNSWLIFFLALTLTYFIAEISFRFFESPILLLKENFRGQHRN